MLAFDVGGTDMKAALIDESGRMLELERVRTPVERDGKRRRDLRRDRSSRRRVPRHATPDSMLPRRGTAGSRLRRRHSGIGIFSENLGWRDVPFRDRASALLGMPVAFSHDVRGAGEAEYRLGAAAPFNDVVVMAIGTGIAGAIFLAGAIHVGGGLAGEMGHSDRRGRPGLRLRRTRLPGGRRLRRRRSRGATTR